MTAAKQDTISIRLNIPATLQARMEYLVQVTGRSESDLAAEALQDYIEREAWQMEAIHKGVEAANNGEFAEDEEVRRRFARWGAQLED